MNKLVAPVLSPTKTDFHKHLALYRQNMPFKPEYVGMVNPYDNSTICGPADYDLYLREKLFHDMCEKAAAEELGRRTRLITEKASKKSFLSFFFSVLIVLALALFVFPASLISSKNESYDTGYQKGLSAGYEEGVLEGYEEGVSDGYKEGVSKGYDDGVYAGYREAATDQFNLGYNAGLNENRSSGSSGSSQPQTAPSTRLPANDQSTSIVVYITATGSKYHRSGCSYLSNSKYETTLTAAKASGYTACSRCKP